MSSNPWPTPPRWADRFLEWFCHPDLLEEIQGDVYELFAIRQQSMNAKTARRRFVWDVFRSFRWSTIKRFNSPISPDMIRNNSKIAWRQIRKDKLYAAIKIGGFALGIAACFLIGLFVQDELSYDEHFAAKDQLYRLVWHDPGIYDVDRAVFTPAPLAKNLVKDYPTIEQAGRLTPTGVYGKGPRPFRIADDVDTYNEEGFIFFDQSLVDILELSMVSGDRSTALSQPGSVIISARKAQQYFGSTSPIGRSIIINNEVETPYTISAVMEDFPTNSHMAPFHFLISLAGVEFWEGEQENWRFNNYHTYLRLQPDTDVQALEGQLKGLVDNYYIPSRLNVGLTDEAKSISNVHFSLQPITDIHLYSEGVVDLLAHGDIRFVRILSGIALFILLLACINFINLSTAKSANRAKEVGLRKVVGSQRTGLIAQFLTESVLFSFLSIVLSIALAALLLPYFNQLANKELQFPWLSWWLLPLMLVGGLTIGLISGVYPAFYLSGFKPIEVLRGTLSTGFKNSYLRNSLVIFQFVTSIILIVGTLVIYQQMDFILQKQLGFDKDQVVVLSGTHTLGNGLSAFQEELRRLPQVKDLTLSDYLPISSSNRNSNGFIRRDQEHDGQIYAQIWEVDEHYISTLGMEIIQGRDFRQGDSTAAIVNQAMIEQLGISGDPLGVQINNGDDFDLEIVGVINDFHFASFKENIGGLCLTKGYSPSMLSIKVAGGDLTNFTAALEDIWEQFAPNQPLSYSYLDEQFAMMYSDVLRTRSIFITFAILAILIACLGLFGLSAFMMEQRTKEVSIRKVLGASSPSLFRLLTQNFLFLVGIAFIIAAPVAWYLMQTWLADFVYRIDLSWWPFASAGILAIVIALLTVSHQAIQATFANPIEALQR